MPGGTDGPGVPVGKKETEGRQGKEEDGQAKTREIKLGCMFTPTGWMRKIVWYAMRSHPTIRGIESAEAFGPRIYQEAKHRSLDRAAEVCGFGDGAFWIWNITDEPFSGAPPLSICSLSAGIMGASPGPALGRRKKPCANGRRTAAANWTVAREIRLARPSNCSLLFQDAKRSGNEKLAILHETENGWGILILEAEAFLSLPASWRPDVKLPLGRA
jgi:hypothetical protein